MNNYKLKKIFASSNKINYFFGYYDKSPLDRDSTRHLALRVDFIDRQPNSNDIATIGYFDINSNEFIELTYTNTFNWQQGAMLQWLGPNFTDEIIFNRRIDNEFISVIYNIKTGAEKHLSLPIYTVNKIGTTALCIDFERHYWCRRGYAYDGVKNIDKNIPIVPNDGIWMLNINNNEQKKVVEIEDLLKISPMKSMRGATHYVEHIMFNPAGNKFSFLHRWKTQSGGLHTRLYVTEIKNFLPRLIDDTGRLTHYSWINEDEIIAWGSKPTIVTTLRKTNILANIVFKNILPLYKKFIKGNAINGHSTISRSLTGDSYILIDTVSGKSKAQFKKLILRDGHPSAIKQNSDWIVTDTYPDINSKALLIAGNIKTQKVLILDELNSIPKFDNSPYRCDLHPKVSLDGRFISIDTMNDGVRGIYLYELPTDFQNLF